MNLGNAQVEMIQNGGPLADTLLKVGFTPHALRPFVGEDGRNYIVNAKPTGEHDKVLPVTNATLLKDEWIQLDRAVVAAALPRMRVVGGMQAKGLTTPLADAMGVSIFQYQNASETRDAQVSMDGINRGENASQQFDLTSMPIPIVSLPFEITARELAMMRRDGRQLDTSLAEAATRKVTEMLEKLALGTAGTFVFGGATLYGLTNHPHINTATVIDWDSSTKTQAQRLTDVIALKAASQADRHFGPWTLYVSYDWEQWLDEDYNTYASKTLRARILDIEGIASIEVTDYLTAKKLLLVENTKETADVIVGMNPTVIQWQTNPLQYNFQVMAILPVRVRSDYNQRSGIVYAGV